MNRIGGLPWRSPSPTAARCRRRRRRRGRARPRTSRAASARLAHRAQMNSLASKGEWKADLEKKAA
jgi:fructose-bisphosphate aldolase class I